MSNDPEAIATAESSDGLRIWQLLRRPAGFYVYEENTLQEELYAVNEDGSEDNVVAEAYWMPTHVSGLFATAEEAKADAVATLGWLMTLCNHRLAPAFRPITVVGARWRERQSPSCDANAIRRAAVQ